VFAYNRKDDRIFKNRTMSTQKIEVLRVLLLKRGLKPPYLLVGHSLGGLYMQYYTKKYPNEVIGLVLVDSTHPNDFIDLSKFPKKIAKQFFHLAKYVHKFSQDLLVLPTIDTPMIVLVAKNKCLSLQRKEMIPLIEIMKKIAQSFPILYPNCKLQWVDTGHMIMYDNPKIVIDSIKELLKLTHK
jgi:pimeloyl-ACP methyl ester carboxylesterase